ncbi:hypothetical protein [Thermosulfuriphilus sp.]
MWLIEDSGDPKRVGDLLIDGDTEETFFRYESSFLEDPGAFPP